MTCPAANSNKGALVLPVEETAAMPLRLPLPRFSDAVQPWVAAFVGLLAFALVSAMGAAYFFKIRLDSLAATSSAISLRASDLSAQVAELTEQSRAIKAE